MHKHKHELCLDEGKTKSAEISRVRDVNGKRKDIVINKIHLRPWVLSSAQEEEDDKGKLSKYQWCLEVV